MAAGNFTGLPHFGETLLGHVHLPVFHTRPVSRSSPMERSEGDQFMPVFSNRYQIAYDFPNAHLVDPEYQNEYEFCNNSLMATPWLHSHKTGSTESSRIFQNKLPDLYDSRASIISHTSSPTAEGSDVRYLEQSSVQSPWSSPPEYTHVEIYPESPHNRVKSSDEEESFCDKPYARLIFEALMQAPGHKMMLRQIYEWFQKNTTKPQESGTNGWQNSIRHNLSMNKAFENDKVDVRVHSGNHKKANSIWMLTENAIKNGVQSTTRYRKTGNTKKVAMNRTPAVQRQQSGAKGGRAARRTARLRRKEQNAGSQKFSSITSSVGLHQQPTKRAERSDLDYLYGGVSPIPTDEPRPVTPADVPFLTNDATNLPSYVKSEFRDVGLDQHHMHNVLFHQSQDHNIRQDPELVMAMHGSQHPGFVPSFHW